MLSVCFVEFALETSDELVIYGGNCVGMVFESLLDKLLLLCIEPLALLFGNQVFKGIAVSHCMIVIRVKICLNVFDKMLFSERK